MTMNSNACSLLFFMAAYACLFLSPATTSAFNITTILSGYPNYNNFNQLLSQTGLADLINARSTITVLVVADGAMGSISSYPIDVAKRILSTHVVLDYYDMTKFNTLQGSKSIILTTLYQTTGSANDQQGFLNVTKSPNGILFGSAAKGAPLNSHLVGSVMNRPYNISVVEVSAVIIAPGIDSITPAKAPAPAPAANSSAPAPAPKTNASAPAPAPKANASAPAPAPKANASAPAHAPTPKAHAPTPKAHAPKAPADAPTPAADAPKADADAPSPSADSPDSPADKPKKSAAASSSVSGATALILGLVVALGLC